jgi:anti-sigma factor RsiW
LTRTWRRSSPTTTSASSDVWQIMRIRRLGDVARQDAAARERRWPGRETRPGLLALGAPPARARLGDEAVTAAMPAAVDVDHAPPARLRREPATPRRQRIRSAAARRYGAPTQVRVRCSEVSGP